MSGVVKIPSGDYELGIPDTIEFRQSQEFVRYTNADLRIETIQTLYVDQNLVTEGQFYSFLLESRGRAIAEKFGVREGSMYPVRGIRQSWASKYCDWKGGRLLTTTEWYICAEGLDKHNWPKICKKRKAPPKVGAYPQLISRFNLMDMVGVLMEWTSDCIDQKFLALGIPHNFNFMDHHVNDQLLALASEAAYGNQYPPFNVGFRCCYSEAQYSIASKKGIFEEGNDRWNFM